MLVLVCTLFFRGFPTLAHGSMLAGAVLWVVGNVLWLAGSPLYAVAPSWIGFLLLLIAGERLELNRILRPSRASVACFLLAALAAITGGLLASFEGRFHPPSYEWGMRLLGARISLSEWGSFRTISRGSRSESRV